MYFIYNTSKNTNTLTSLHISEIWSSQVNFTLTITPRNLVCLTHSNLMMSVLILTQDLCGLVMNSIQLHFIDINRKLQ